MLPSIGGFYVKKINKSLVTLDYTTHSAPWYASVTVIGPGWLETLLNCRSERKSKQRTSELSNGCTMAAPVSMCCRLFDRNGALTRVRKLFARRVNRSIARSCSGVTHEENELELTDSTIAGSNFKTRATQVSQPPKR